jgi:hypothetical protein
MTRVVYVLRANDLHVNRFARFPSGIIEPLGRRKFLARVNDERDTIFNAGPPTRA